MKTFLIVAAILAVFDALAVLAMMRGGKDDDE